MPKRCGAACAGMMFWDAFENSSDAKGVGEGAILASNRETIAERAESTLQGDLPRGFVEFSMPLLIRQLGRR